MRVDKDYCVDRSLKIKAHAAFDLLWQERFYSRDDAYTWLASLMNVKRSQAHIGCFTNNQLHFIIDYCGSYILQLREADKLAREHECKLALQQRREEKKNDKRHKREVARIHRRAANHSPNYRRQKSYSSED